MTENTQKTYWETHNATLRKDGTWDEYEIDGRGRRLPLSKFNLFIDRIRGVLGMKV